MGSSARPLRRAPQLMCCSAGTPEPGNRLSGRTPDYRIDCSGMISVLLRDFQYRNIFVCFRLLHLHAACVRGLIVKAHTYASVMTHAAHGFLAEPLMNEAIILHLRILYIHCTGSV